MTTRDAPRADAWDEAGALARRAAGGAVTRHGAALPYAFDGPAGPIVVHHGAVVTARGPAVAGAYLRDLGVIRGAGPAIDDVVYGLGALGALPTVDGLAPAAFVRGDDVLRVDLHPRLETDGETARVVLHYLLATAPPQPVDRDPSHRRTGAGTTSGGSPSRSDLNVEVRAVARLSLTIPGQGDARWVREDLAFAVPR